MVVVALMFLTMEVTPPTIIFDEAIVSYVKLGSCMSPAILVAHDAENMQNTARRMKALVLLYMRNPLRVSILPLAS